MSYIKGTHIERLIDRTFDNLAKRFGTKPVPVKAKSTTTKTKKTKTVDTTS